MTFGRRLGFASNKTISLGGGGGVLLGHATAGRQTTLSVRPSVVVVVVAVVGVVGVVKPNTANLARAGN